MQGISNTLQIWPLLVLFVFNSNGKARAEHQVDQFQQFNEEPEQAGLADDENYPKQAKDLHNVNKYKTFIVFNEGKICLADYFRDPRRIAAEIDPYMPSLWGAPNSYGKWDFDHDGKEELIFTFIPSAGGMWSTTKYFIFEPVSSDIFKFSAKLTIGSSEDYRKKDRFSFVLYLKVLVDFFTDGIGTGYYDEDKLKSSDLTFVYKNNRFVINNSYKELNKSILFNLKWMRSHSGCDTVLVEDKEQIAGNDDGFRRRFCLETLSFYLMTKNWEKTRQLFYLYYPCNDKDKVWKELKERIKFLLERNTL